MAPIIPKGISHGQYARTLQEDAWNKDAAEWGDGRRICFHIDRTQSKVGRTLFVVECDYCEMRAITGNASVDQYMMPYVYKPEYI